MNQLSSNNNELSPEQIKEEVSQKFQKHNHAVAMPDFSSMDHTPWYKKDWLYELKEWNYYKNPFSAYKHVSSANEYINLPWKERSVWYFWYMDYIVSGKNGRLWGRKEDNEKIENFLKKNHFIQYHIREWSFIAKIKLSNFKHWCSHTIRPRQKWLTKQIPKSWADKTWLIPELNFAMVVHFVEGEKAMDVTDWVNSGDAHAEFETALKDCYDYIKVRRPQLQKDLDNAYPDLDKSSGDYWKDYAEVNRIETLLDKEDTKYLVWIVTNRDFFWT